LIGFLKDVITRGEPRVDEANLKILKIQKARFLSFLSPGGRMGWRITTSPSSPCESLRKSIKSVRKSIKSLIY
jgi:hypothetical protein